jgi:hypothetical protein
MMNIMTKHQNRTITAEEFYRTMDHLITYFLETPQYSLLKFELQDLSTEEQYDIITSDLDLCRDFSLCLLSQISCMVHLQ